MGFYAFNAAARFISFQFEVFSTLTFYIWLRLPIMPVSCFIVRGPWHTAPRFLGMAAIPSRNST